MNALAEKLAQQIRAAGPIGVADFMAACLHDPEHGYYATRPRLGGAGADFLTAPEASQMFGELIGLWCAHEWEKLGKPEFNLIELGPGRGVLMQDALRATARIDGFHKAARIVLVELSAPLRAEQRARVAEAAWIDRLELAPPGASLILANEFLDCLPIRQFARTRDGWREKLVGINADGALSFGLSPPLLFPPTVSRCALDTSPVNGGGVLEYAPALAGFVATLAARLHAAPGRALIADYGYGRPEGADTLQALSGHAKCDPLAAPGEADLTAHVDFAALAQLAAEAGLAVHGPVPQADFLRALGLDRRAEALMRANPERAERIAREHRRLTHAEEMGVLFKMLCLSSPNLPPPAGF